MDIMYKDSDIRKLKFGDPEINLGDGLKCMAWKSMTIVVIFLVIFWSGIGGDGIPNPISS